MNIQKFNLTSMVVPNSAIYVQGCRGQGKTLLVKDILSQCCSDIPSKFLFESNEYHDFHYKDIIPDEFHFQNGYDEKIINHILNQQKAKIYFNQHNKKQTDSRCVVCLEEIMYAKTNNAALLELVLNGKHHKTTTIITSQYPLHFTPKIRANFDYVFLLRTTNVKELKLIYECFAGMFFDFNAFLGVYNDCVKDYGCMVINNCAESSNLFDKVFWYRVDYVEPTNVSTPPNLFDAQT